MKRSWTLASALVLAVAATSGAQERVGVIDIETVFAKYKRPAVLEQEIRAAQQASSEQAEARRQQIERKREALQAFKPGTPDFDEKYRALRREEIDFQIWRTLEEETIKKRHRDSFNSIYEDVRRGVAEVARRHGFDIVLTYDSLAQEAPDSQTLRQQILLQKVIYWTPKIDVTDDVLKVINDAFDATPPVPPGEPGSDAAPTNTPTRHVSGSDAPSRTVPASAPPARATRSGP